MSDTDILTGEQLRGARAMLRWEQRELSAASGVPVPTLKRMEAMNGAVRGTYGNVTRVRRALEAAGVEFLNDDAPGVRLHARQAP